MACMFYFARCMNIIFNSLLAQCVKSSYNSQYKIDTCYFSHMLFFFSQLTKRNWQTERRYRSNILYTSYMK